MLIAESDGDMEIGAFIEAGFDILGNFIVKLSCTDYEYSKYDYEQSVVLDSDEYAKLARYLRVPCQELPVALGERCGDRSSLLVPSDVRSIFKDIIELILDSGARYKLKR